MKTILRLPANDKNLKWQIILETYIDYLLKKTRRGVHIGWRTLRGKNDTKLLPIWDITYIKTDFDISRLGVQALPMSCIIIMSSEIIWKSIIIINCQGLRKCCDKIYEDYNFSVKGFAYWRIIGCPLQIPKENTKKF